MSIMNYDGRKFVAIANSENGEVSAQTIFSYHQQGDIVWAEYAGGDVLKGFLLGTATLQGNLHFTYQHVNRQKELRVGICDSEPTMLPDGRLRLVETWRWLNGDCSAGESVIEELREE